MTENQCLIEHPFGRIDASIDTQLEQIRNVLDQVTMEKKS
jgi:flagellar assembly protein FliH